MVEIKYIIPFLTLLLGVFLGNRLALGLDKRKEHNAVVLPLKQKVLAYIDLLKKSEHSSFSENEITTLRGIVSERKYDEIKKLHHEFIRLVRDNRQINQSGYFVFSTESDTEISNVLKEIESALVLK